MCRLVMLEADPHRKIPMDRSSRSEVPWDTSEVPAESRSLSVLMSAGQASSAGRSVVHVQPE